MVALSSICIRGLSVNPLRYARANGFRTFDMGAVTPTDDPSHPHYSVYEYKRRWGGRLVMVPSAQVVLSPTRAAFQDWCLKPFWDRVHPLYLRIFRTA